VECIIGNRELGSLLVCCEDGDGSLRVVSVMVRTAGNNIDIVESKRRQAVSVDSDSLICCSEEQSVVVVAVVFPELAPGNS